MSDESAPRIKPLLPPDWDSAVHDATLAFPASREFVLNHWQSGDARGVHGLGVILNHPLLAKSFLTFNNHIATENSLSKREAELLILRVSWLRRSEYEFQQHVVLGLRAGLSEEEIESIQDGPGAVNWNATDAALLQAVDDLVNDACVQPDTWSALCKHYDQKRRMDLVFTVGCYEVLAMAFKTFAVPFESCLEPMGPETKERMYG